MNKKEFYTKFEEDFIQYVKTVKAKNSDYSGDNDDPFTNFKQVEVNGICSVEAGILVRMTDKFSRITHLLLSGKKGEVLSESVTDTLGDLIVYTEILKLYVEYAESKRSFKKFTTQKDIDDRLLIEKAKMEAEERHIDEIR